MQLAPCVLAREQLQQLLAGGVDRRCNAVSARMDTVTGWWCRNCQRTGERAQVQRLLTRGLQRLLRSGWWNPSRTVCR